MNAIQGLILGIVQGLTEFLPISSSGHLLVLQKIFGIDTDGQLLLNILLHLGTLVAVFAVYWRRIWNMLRHPIPVSYTHLDVYKRQPTTLAQRPP